MRESEIERYLVKQVAKAGGRAYKWVSPGNAGIPDRIVIIPGEPVCFVELKAPGERLSKQQQVQHRKLKAVTGWVFTISSKLQVDEFIQHFTNEL